MSKNLPAVLEDIELGPAAQKLSKKRLHFAAALVFEVPAGPDAVVAAGKIAGYADATAKQLARDKTVAAAVEELARQRLTLDVPIALDTLRSAMTDKYGKDRVKAAQAILDRVVPTKQEIRVEATVVDRQQQTLDYLAHLISKGATEEMLLAEFGPVGLDRYRKALAEREASKAKVIDADFEVVNEAAPAPQPEPAAPSVVEDTDDELGDIL
jgi:hypothetical protein